MFGALKNAIQSTILCFSFSQVTYKLSKHQPLILELTYLVVDSEMGHSITVHCISGTLISMYFRMKATTAACNTGVFFMAMLDSRIPLELI